MAIIRQHVMAIDTVEQVEVIPGRGNISFYLDRTARALEAQFPPANIQGPGNPTGDERLTAAVWPLLLAAKNTSTYWGFDYEGYRRLVDYFARPDYDEEAGQTRAPEVDHATQASIKDVIRTEKDLTLLVDEGWLRAEPYKSPEGRISVYFITAKLAKNAVAETTRHPAKPPPTRAIAVPPRPKAPPQPAPPPPQTRIVVRGSRSNITTPRLRPIL
jgi:hypothetical protein